MVKPHLIHYCGMNVAAIVPVSHAAIAYRIGGPRTVPLLFPPPANHVQYAIAL